MVPAEIWKHRAVEGKDADYSQTCVCHCVWGGAEIKESEYHKMFIIIVVKQ